MTTSGNKPVRVRLAPSPTGLLHIGLVRTALFNWLFARQKQGAFILRIEDTDGERSEKKYEQEILEGLLWLGLSWDEGPILDSPKYIGEYGPYRQSERGLIYKNHLTKLIEEKRAYYCYCTKEELEAQRQAMLAQGLPPKYDGHCRNLEKAPAGKKPEVIRFKTPETKVEFKDIIRGKVSFDAGTFGDLVIAKDTENPLYNFAVVIDDSLMKISHVIRGEDHISNTPKQILLQRALGLEEVSYAHLPLILNPDRSKLSKRHVETSLLEYRNQGYLPKAVINFLALLGWHPEQDREILSIQELVKEFDLKRVQKSGAIFNTEKLEWLNKEYVKNLSTEEITDSLEPFLKAKSVSVPKHLLSKIVVLERARMKNLNNFLEIAGFFFQLPNYEASLLVWQKESSQKIKTILKESLEVIRNIKASEFNRRILAESLANMVDKEGRGPVFWPLRVAVSGLAASPDPLEIIEILGPEETEKRLLIAIDKINESMK